MTAITYQDIESELKKIPLEKLPAVYKILHDFSLSPRNTQLESVMQVDDRETSHISSIKDLCGILRPEDIRDNDKTRKNERTGKTNYAATVDEVVYGIGPGNGDTGERENSD